MSTATAKAIGTFHPTDKNCRGKAFAVVSKTPAGNGYQGHMLDGSYYYAPAIYWRFEPADEAPAVWDGKGIPPADTVCEFNSNWAHAAGGSTWHIVTVVFSSAESYVVRRNSAPEGETTELCGPATGYEISRFRPIRTPEQIAAEEREKAIDDMERIVPHLGSVAAGKLYDAGYRKQVAP